MKQYLNSDQTAKLIELGLADSIREERYKRGALPKNYSVGELIEMLPEVLAPSNDTDLEMPLNISTDSLVWTVEYDGAYETASVELIDALYDMCVNLKEEGVI